MNTLLSAFDLNALQKKIDRIEAYMRSDEFQMLRESTQIDYFDWVNGMKLRLSYAKFAGIERI